MLCLKLNSTCSHATWGGLRNAIVIVEVFKKSSRNFTVKANTAIGFYTGVHVTLLAPLHCALLQEALISHGCTKSEAAAAEHMFKSISYKPTITDSPYCELPSAAQKGRTPTAPGSSPRDVVPASSSDADAAAAAPSKDVSAASVIASKDSGAASVTASKDAGAASAAGSKDAGAASARGGVAAKGAAAVAAGAHPKDAIIDYTMFEQLWMADFSSPTAKM